MSEKFLSSEQYILLKQNYPELFDAEKRRILIDVIGSYTQKVLELLPEELYPESFLDEQKTLLENKEYVGRKVIEILQLESKDIALEKQLGTFFLSEIMRDRSETRIWRSMDTKTVFEYSLNTHGDTFISGTQCDMDVQGHLSFDQSVYPLIDTLLAYIRTIDTEWKNTLQKWDWQKVFFSSRGNPWKGTIEFIPYERRNTVDTIFNDVLYDDVQTIKWDGISFGLANRRPCFSVLDREKKQLSFYVENPEGTVQIGGYWLFKSDFILKEADVENMFLVLCQLVARDWKEIFYGIMKYFPEYYQELVWK